MRLIRIFLAIFTAICVIIASDSCQKEDLLNIVDVLNISIPVVPGTKVTANGKVQIAIDGSNLSKTENGEYFYDFSITKEQTGVDFGKFEDKVNVQANHFEVLGSIENNTDYDMCGTVEIEGGDTKVIMESIIKAHATTDVTAEVYCNGNLTDIKEAKFHVNIINGDDNLFEMLLPDIKVSCSEVRFLSGGSIKI